MAKKAKTPPPPRVQAPKKRRDEPDPRRTRMLLYGAGATGLLALAVVAIVVFAGGAGGSDSKAEVASAMTAAGCTYKNVPAFVPDGKPLHVNSLTAKLKWNTFPPSNGQHYPNWAVWDFYSEPVNPRMIVHNEEHGGVVLWWGPKTPAAEVDRLRELYNESPVSMVGTPIEGLGRKVAITAWTGDPSRYGRSGYYGEGHVAVCPRLGDATLAAFRDFRDAYRGQGPEGVPEESNQPGSGPS